MDSSQAHPWDFRDWIDLGNVPTLDQMFLSLLPGLSSFTFKSLDSLRLINESAVLFSQGMVAVSDLEPYLPQVVQGQRQSEEDSCLHEHGLARVGDDLIENCEHRDDLSIVLMD